MTNLDLLHKYLGIFIAHSKVIGKEVDATIFKGHKPSGYYTPKLLDYLNHPPYSNRGTQIDISLFLEIWIDGLCVWRKSRTIAEGNTGDLIEEMAERMLNEIFLHGIFHAWDVIKKLKDDSKP